MRMPTILVVDDEKEIRELIGIYLKNEDYIVQYAKTGIEAINIMNEQLQNIDLVILDVMMPVVNGIDACLEIRQKYNTPIIMVSAKANEIDKIHGLSSGADDYITKPFSPLELLARVKAQIRRATKFNQLPRRDTMLLEGELMLDLEKNTLFKNDIEIILTPTEYNILKYLWANKGITIKAKDIYEKVWGQTSIDNNTVMVHIRKLREKIEENPREPRYIFTIWGIGYKFLG
ncbi:MAG: DNA-binding response regulator [Epulopiscium sp. Nuni2H_MBin003]|nr:MAG: DNA-binding response regulator [Epulopiscium sp. Nuni2H_MBin003]